MEQTTSTWPSCARSASGSEAVEVEAWGRPTFRAGKRMFAGDEVALQCMLKVLDQQGAGPTGPAP